MHAVTHWTAERCAALLKKAHRTPEGWKACCPAHDDKNPSLFLTDGKDGVAAVCYAGCEYRDIMQALENLGAVVSTGARDRSEIPAEHFQLGAYHAHWDYRDRAGTAIMRVCRWEQPGGKKDIRPLVRTGDGWKWQHHPTPRPLFQLDRLINEPEARVVIVEGEKAAAAAQKLFPDCIATTWPGGAQSVGQADWSPLVGREVTLVPDCDSPGRKAMGWVRQHIKATARAVRVMDPGNFIADLPEGWDLADALTEGRDVSAMMEASASIALPSRIKRLDAILSNPTRPRWLIRDVLEEAVVALMAGPRGSYKSFVAMHWAMTIVAEGSPVLVISAEGSGLDRRIRAWLAKHFPMADRAVLPLYAIEQRIDFNSAEAMQLLVEEIEALQIKPVFIVIDTLSKNSGALDENSNSEVKAFIGRLDTELRRRYNASILLVHHTGHIEKGRARGASALEADTDAAYIITRTPGQHVVSVSRERFKDSADLGPLIYKADIVDLGECDDDGKPVTSLALVPADADTVTTEARGAQPRGLRQRELLKALKGLQAKSDAAVHWTAQEIKEIGRSLGMSKQSAQDAAAALTAFYLRACIGGYRLLERGEK
jgi:hypothetical protein